MYDCSSRNSEFVERLTAVELRNELYEKRIAKLESITEAVYDLAGSMKILAEKQTQTAMSVEKLDEKVSAIEAQPGKNWNALIEKIVWAVVAAFVGYALSQIGL